MTKYKIEISEYVCGDEKVYTCRYRRMANFFSLKPEFVDTSWYQLVSPFVEGFTGDFSERGVHEPVFKDVRSIYQTLKRHFEKLDERDTLMFKLNDVWTGSIEELGNHLGVSDSEEQKNDSSK